MLSLTHTNVTAMRERNHMDTDQLLTTDQAAEILNVPPGTMRWWRYQQTGPKAFRLGGRKVMYKRSDVMAWLERQYSEQVLAP